MLFTPQMPMPTVNSTTIETSIAPVTRPLSRNAIHHKVQRRVWTRGAMMVSVTEA